ncbi:speA [Scenedesmus sp. PABB004]|nr:speA [Scenedesmus sp. PABB004]
MGGAPSRPAAAAPAVRLPDPPAGGACRAAGAPEQPEFCRRMAWRKTPSHAAGLAARVRWRRALAAAATPAGGGWRPDFTAADLTPRRLSALAGAIDSAFFDGTFAAACGRPGYAVRGALPSAAAPGLSAAACSNAVAGYEPASNTIVVFSRSPLLDGPAPSLAAPTQADGYYVRSRLEWLAHALGHEMVHCIVESLCPASRDSPELYGSGHGPVFARLNRTSRTRATAPAPAATAAACRRPAAAAHAAASRVIRAESPLIAPSQRPRQRSAAPRAVMAYAYAPADEESGLMGSLFDKSGPSLEFAEREVRLGFVRKVFGLLSVQLAITAAMTAGVILNPGLKGFVYHNPWTFWVAFAASLVLVGVLSCVEAARRAHPWNLVALFAFTACEGVLVATISSMYDTDVVLMAAGLTAGVTCCLSAYAMTTRRDFTASGGIMFSLLLTLLGAGLLSMLMPSRTLSIAVAAAGAAVFAVYIVFDVQLMMGSGSAAISPDEYVMAAINIYLDVQPHATPLLDAVHERGARATEAPFHVPGHKRGRALDPGMRRLLAPPDGADGGGGNALRHDLTELAGLDFLSSPSGVIAAAQAEAAAAFGADATWLLVNGCSAGVHAAVLATLSPGQALLLPRNCHLSAFAACVLAGAEPVWLAPETDAAHGVAHGVVPAEIAAGFDAAAERGLVVGAALVVSPTYYGAVARVPELAAVCHARGVPLLVDEAHGGHLSFLPASARASSSGSSGSSDSSNGGGGGGGGNGGGGGSAPLGALAGGADVVLQSSHKVLTAMTQAAMLHVQGPRVRHERVSRALQVRARRARPPAGPARSAVPRAARAPSSAPARTVAGSAQVLQTSSPSYLLLASLDAARAHAARPGAWDAPLAVAAAARAGLARLPGLALLQAGACASDASVAGFDPLRVVVNVSGLGLTGYAAAEALETRHGVVPELATAQLVVLVVGPGSVMADADALLRGFADLCAAAGPAPLPPPAQPPAPPVQQQQRDRPPPPALSPRAAFFAQTEAVPLAAAAGRVSGELLCPYPPGVPLAFPGERLTPGAVDALAATLAAGGAVTGAADPTLGTVRVCVEP